MSISDVREQLMDVELLAITPDAEKVIESAGRTAYLSFGKRSEGSEKKFIRMLLKNRHYSVLEHASATFRISGVSRAMTHQLVRHRLCSFTQQSQRYVNEKDFQFIEPASISNYQAARTKYRELMDAARRTYAELQEMGIRNEDARFVLPQCGRKPACGLREPPSMEARHRAAMQTELAVGDKAGHRRDTAAPEAACADRLRGPRAGREGDAGGGAGG